MVHIIRSHESYKAKYKYIRDTCQQDGPKGVTYNVDGTPNRKGDIVVYTDLEVCIGEKKTNMRFFITNLGTQRMILGYPWFAAMQLRIDWAKGWLDYDQLPIVIKMSDAHKAMLVRRNELKTKKRELSFPFNTNHMPKYLAKKSCNDSLPLKYGITQST